MAEVFAEDAVTGERHARRPQASRSCRRAAPAVPGSGSSTGRRPGFAHTADLSEPGLLAAARAAAAVARQGGDAGAHGGAGPARRTTARGDRTPPETDRQGAQARAARPAPTTPPAPPGTPSPRCRSAAATAGAACSSPTPTASSRSDDQIRTRFNVVCVANGDTGMQTGLRVAGPDRGLRDLRASPRGGDAPSAAAARALTKLIGPSRALGRGADRARGRQRRHPLPRGVRARPRGRPHREGRVGLHRAGSASWSPARSSPSSTTARCWASGATSPSTTRDTRRHATC